MHNEFDITPEMRQPVDMFLRKCVDTGRTFLLYSDIQQILEEVLQSDCGAHLKGSEFEKCMIHAEEAALHDGWLYLAVRLDVAKWRYYRFNVDQLLVQPISVREFLVFKEWLVDPLRETDPWALELDMSPFEREFPKLKQVNSIGHGVEFLNRHLARTLKNKEQVLFDFLKLHHYGDVQFLLNDQVGSVEELQELLQAARKHIRRIDPDMEWKAFYRDLPGSCFEAGWGRTAKQADEMMSLLLDLLESPTAKTLEAFVARIPMISRLAILSPHGYFGQSHVLGLPDTGGQVVYILDQVRALERQMLDDLYQQGLDIAPDIVVLTRLIPEAEGTTCNQRIEPIIGTQHARILRVPFRTAQGEVVPHWISRFELWPYLERFTIEAERELLAEMGGKPDVVIGNYSDGNLVASLMTKRLGVTQCNIAHALEKTKYLYSALHWDKHEEQYHFSCQFTADLIAMNTADFIITSSYQEIAGTEESVGQYESYGSFTMPGLCRTLQGINVFDPKFNIVAPGADEQVYFPYTRQDERLQNLHDEIRGMVYGEASADARGRLADDTKPLLFAMSRLDKIKNVTGLLRWYAENSELQELTNLFLVAGKVDPNTSLDQEERDQCLEMHNIINEFGLEDKVRWVKASADRNFNGELYRFVADSRGAFVQPALFEAFGLTVIEAMNSGLPVFATCFGGPSEIIEDRKSGFHINPNNGAAASAIMVEFFRQAAEDEGVWQRYSEGALARIEAAYTWRLYAKRMLTLSRIYGFWKHITNIEREETRRYLEMFYALMFRKRAALIGE
jgi:sucrose synthase